MVRTRVAGRNPASKRLHELSWPGPSGPFSLAECDSLAGGEPKAECDSLAGGEPKSLHLYGLTLADLRLHL